MACVQQAVLEFDEEVRSPWRPRLVAGGVDAARPGPARELSSRNPSRVGACRQPAAPAPLVALAGRPAPRPAADGGVVRSGSVDRMSGARARSGRPTPVGLRLTRRARRLAVILALAAGVALGSWISPLVAGGSDDLRLAGGSSVVVQPGDTLWSIASALGQEDDVRTLVDEIQRLNDLESADLVPGQMLQLP
jgi:hypothetical protein